MFVRDKFRLFKRYLLRRWEGEKILKTRYKSVFGSDIDLSNPRTFSEKIFERMVKVNRYGNQRFTELADKYLVRDWVRSQVGEQYLVPLIWHGTDPERIPFDSLPALCIAKTNHGSGGHIVLDRSQVQVEVIRKLNKSLSENFYWEAREYHYYKIPRKILIEEFIDDLAEDGPLDYRFWCFKGTVEVIQVDNHLHSINPFYDTTWVKLPLTYREKFQDCDVPKPINLDDMISVASKLSSDFDFVRVDLYNVNGKIYVGEMTFTPMAGNFILKPESWNILLGEKWTSNVVSTTSTHST